MKMSRFNSTAVDPTKTTNLAGGGAYTLTSEMELYSRVCTASLYPKYYEAPQDTVARIRELVSECSPEFVAKLAVYAREKMNLRTIPLVLTVELAKVHRGDSLVSRLTKRVIQRVDELTEILAYYQFANERTGTKKLGKLSKQLEKGIAGAFTKFDEYQFGKYNRETEVKLRDALFLSHAKPENEEQEGIFNKIVEGTLETPYTWETRLSEAGQNGETKKDVWEELIDSRKVGYMALLRNLRNILQAGVSNEHITKVCDYLSNENAVKGSKQLPFRFLSAYRMLTTGVAPTLYRRWNTARYEVDTSVTDNPQLGRVLNALETAIVISAQNIPMFDNENVLIATDVSGSMCSPVSPKSVINMYDIGAVLAMLVHHKAQNTVTGLFGDKFEAYPFPKTGVLRNAEKVYELEGRVGYSTNGYKVLQYANRNNTANFDKIMIFTDCQMYGSSRYGRASEHSAIEREWKQYKQNNPNAKLYLFDLNGYGTSPVSLMDNDVTLISGWSDKVFDIMNAVDNGSTAIDEILAIEL
jgi:hypothetical protein